MSRKVAREYAYKLIFEFLFSKSTNSHTYQLFTCADLTENDIQYLENIYFGVAENYNELISIISEYSHGFAVERIYKTDLSALLLAIYEMKFIKEIPLSVSISEAVLLVKKYSTEKSNSFVNGILSSIYKNMEISK